MKNHLFKIFLAILVFALCLVSVSAYSTYGAPSEFGNLTTTTCYVGGDFGELNCSGSAKFDGNVTASWFKGLFNWLVGDTFATFNGSTWLQNVTTINATIDLRTISVIHNATNITTTSGTHDGGNLTSIITSEDGDYYNVSEASGAAPLIININFSDVTTFDSVIGRIYYDGGLGHEIQLEIQRTDTGDWENYLDLTDTNDFVNIYVPVFDPVYHVWANGDVALRFYHVQSGVPTHNFFIDYLAIVDGWTALTTAQHDGLGGRNNPDNHPWALDRNGSKALTNNWSAGSFNISASGFFGLFYNSTGALEWIMPEHIFDVDKADIETDLNTFVDIAGDTMIGNLIINANLTVNSTDFFVNSNLGRVGIGTASPEHLLDVGGMEGIGAPGNLGIKSDSGAWAIRIEENSGVEGWHIGVDVDGDLNFDDSNTGIRLTFQDETGNVGIGTTSPGRNVEIYDTSSILRLRDSGLTASATLAYIEFGGTDATAWNRTGFVGDGSSGNADIYLVAEVGDLHLGDSSGFTVLNLQGGNVGIGTTTPQNELNVIGDINSTGLYYGNGSQLSDISQAESDPFWTANQSSYSTTAEILAFGYYNATDFVITDYFTKSNILGFSYYNSTDFDIADYFTSSEVLAFNYYNASDFDIADYFTSAEVLGFSYYNSTDFSISDYSTTAAILGWSYYNVTSFPDNYLLNTGDTASGNYTFDSTTLHIDSTNNRVGIGITSPEKLLHLNGTNPELRISSDSDAGYSILRFGDSSGVLNYILQYDRNHATHPGKLRIEMSSRDFIITGTGNVGIGTTSPEATLDVDGAIRAIGTINPASGSGLEMHHTGGTSYLISYNRTGTAYLPLHLYGDDISFGVAGTIRMFINQSSGNVGIGTASPDNLLHLVGTNPELIIEGDVTPAAKTRLANYVANSFFTHNAYYDGSWHSNDPATGSTVVNIGAEVWRVRTAAATGGADGDPITLSEKMRVHTDGNVGIGTATPLANLHIAPPVGGADTVLRISDPATTYDPAIELYRTTGNLGARIYYDNSVGVLMITNRYDHATGDIRFQTKTTGTPVDAMTIDGNGLVGIGTTSPSTTLDVRGNAWFGTTWKTKIITGNQIDFSRDATNYITASNATGSLAFGSGGRTNDIVIQTDGDFIVNTGDVGIGTSNPNTNLHIKSSAGAETIAKIEATVDTFASSLYLVGNETGQDGAVGKIIGFNKADSLGYMYFLRQDADNSGEISFGTQNAGSMGERVRIDKAGNVGIGDTSPGELLEVAGNINSTGGDICITGGQCLSGAAAAYTAGDALTLTGNEFDFDGGATPAGDLGGTWANPSVDDDSHAHVYSDIDETTSANWIGRVSDETGTGKWVFATSPTFTTGITVPANSISDDELDEGATFDWTAAHTFAASGTFNDDLIFADEIKPDNALCSNNDLLFKTGADNWDCKRYDEIIGQTLTTTSNPQFNNITSIDCIVFDSGGKICSGT